MNLKEEYDFGQAWLLLHKYLYYELNKSVLQDTLFDQAEKHYHSLGVKLGLSQDSGLTPSNMVGFNSESPYWPITKKRYKDIIQRMK